MKKKTLLVFVMVWLALLLAIPSAQAQAVAFASAPSPEHTDPLQFTSAGHVLGFAPREMYAASGSHALRVEFVDAAPVNPVSDSPQSEMGRAAPLERVTLPDLWRGITLSYDAPGGSILRSMYRLEPYANPENIRLRYNVPVRVDEAGNLSVAFETGEMSESAPIAWQEIDGQRIPVAIAFRVFYSNSQPPLVGFALGAYDRSRALNIDPTLTWNTFLGGNGDDRGNAFAVDATSGTICGGDKFRYMAGYQSTRPRIHEWL